MRRAHDEGCRRTKGTRLALASESDGSKRFNESVLKRLTGDDTLRGTKLQQTAFEFKPEFKIWMLANHLPFARDGFDGLVSEYIFSWRMEERGLKKKRTKAGVEYEDVAIASTTSTTF